MIGYEPALSLSVVESAYLETWMSKVSRSFAVVVASLEPPLNHYLAVAYLICRVIDNIEDSTSAPAWKEMRFDDVRQLIDQPDLARAILPIWDGEAWPGLSADQRQLMTYPNGVPLWEIYDRLPFGVKSIISHWALQMAQGMRQLEDPITPPRIVRWNEVQVLEKEIDYNQYCFIVAGTVGHMATELVIYQYGLRGELAQRLLHNCEACGRSLQKTNIVKDFREDLQRGVCYLPDEWLSQVGYNPLALQGATPDWSKKVLGNVLYELQQATEYVLSLPYRVTTYRMASLLCLLPAYQTILMAAQQKEHLFTEQHPQKISHAVFGQCLQDAQSMLVDNAAIRQYSERLTGSVQDAFLDV